MEFSPLEKLYQKIGQQIVNDVGDDWAMAWVCVEISDDSFSERFGHYKKTVKPTTESYSFSPSPEIVDLFYDLQRHLHQDGQNPWTRAIFTLTSSGKFDLKLSYEPLEGFLALRVDEINKQQAQLNGLK
ncbi:MAG: DUF600 family protein [Ardenticatenaceae bacterium]|nr:DUF600 family protein [Ardenticatenaceae bacterium]